MGSTIAVAGKGGVGKTVLSALIIQWLVAQGETPVLAVDADSNANLHEALGISYGATVGSIREEALRQARQWAGVSKQELLNLRVHEALVEQPGFDLIVMGRPEGQGCYCFANNVLREVIQRLTSHYRHVVVDSEAGLEHLSRRTLLSVDLLGIVSDGSVRGVRTARRIADLVDEMGTPVKARGLIVNRVPGGILSPQMQEAVEATGLPLLAVIPTDAHVAAMDAGGLTVDDIPADAPARIAIETLMKEGLANFTHP